MAKIVGGVPPPFIGTRDNLTIYLLKGEYVIRTKSSLTGKRVKRDPVFAKTMKYAGWLKQGARIASRIYRQLPADERIYKQYRELTGKAMLLLKEGFAVDDVITMLEAVYLPQPVENAAGMGTGGRRKFDDEYTSEYSSGNNSVNGNVNSNGCGSKHGSKYDSEYDSEYTGGYCSGCVKYRSKQTSVYVSKCGSRSADKCNGKCYCKCYCGRSCIRVECNGKCAKEYEDAHGYMLPYYSWGDRPQRAVQVGITGLSSLKYADATHKGFNIYSKARYAPLKLNGKELQRSTASGPILQP